MIYLIRDNHVTCLQLTEIRPLTYRENESFFHLLLSIERRGRRGVKKSPVIGPNFFGALVPLCWFVCWLTALGV
jgi:hypothetical protein